MSARRRFFPPDDRVTRWNPDDAERDVDPRGVDLHTGERTQCGLERERRRTEYVSARQVQLRNACGHHILLLRARKQHRSTMAGANQLAYERKPVLAGVFGTGSRIRDHDYVSADRRFDRLRRGDPGAEVVDGRGLEDVECLALRDRAGWIDQASLGHAIAHGERMRYGPAKRSATDYRNETHWTLVF